MLTKDLSDKLEKIQRDVYKTIYGFSVSYADILEANNLPLLSARRKEIFDKFTLIKNVRIRPVVPHTNFHSP